MEDCTSLFSIFRQRQSRLATSNLTKKLSFTNRISLTDPFCYQKLYILMRKEQQHLDYLLLAGFVFFAI
ncbi:hypothetical protein T4E_9186 [Trichinella pseudospiralis]|uniref:Uncharacterized protein n=1 Tax=Trichinella pseudospiralis TaxID=6337 RepID=A0A0V0Y080_TRIPS|nr:hypothetical protein T4E_9186 [Trichinella pseudospiralis]